MAFGLRRAKVWALSVQLVNKISNLCDPDPPTSQTDRRSDDMQSQDRALHYSASCGKTFQSCFSCFISFVSAVLFQFRFARVASEMKLGLRGTLFQLCRQHKSTKFVHLIPPMLTNDNTFSVNYDEKYQLIFKSIGLNAKSGRQTRNFSHYYVLILR